MRKALNLLDKPSKKPLESRPEARFHDVAGVPGAEYLREARAAALRAAYDMTGHILIVDDSLTVRMNLRDGFRGAGHHTVECATIAGGRTAIAKQVPDLIVLDLSMPLMNGLDAAPRLKRLMPVVPIVMFTSFDVKVVLGLALAAGMSAVVGKESPGGLVVAVRALLLTAA